MRKSPSTLLKAALFLALLSGLPAAGFAADVPVVSVLGTTTEQLKAPGKIAMDSHGVLYVADTQNRGILKYDNSGTYLVTLPLSGVVHSIAVTADDRIVASMDSAVVILAPNGDLLGKLTGYDFTFANGIANDAAGNFYVCDSKTNKVAVFNPSGAFSFAFGGSGNGQGQLNYPTGISYERVSNQLAVADTLNNRVQFFDTNGNYKRVIGTPANLSGPLKFTYPQGIAFDYMNGPRMYVADAFQSSVQVIDLGVLPRFLSYIGGYGTASGQLQHPSDVLFDAVNSELLVADSSGLINFYSIAAPAGGGTGGTGGTGGSGGTGSGGTGDPGGSSGSGGGSTTCVPGTACAKQQQNFLYPTGSDCRHARAGSIMCRDK